MANANGMTQGVDSSMPATTALPPQNCTTTDAMDDKEDVDEEVVVIGYLNNWINAYAFVSKNQEKLYLYAIISVTVGILLFMGLIIGRLLVSRHRAKRDAKFRAANETLPNGFTDDISEIDVDIDLNSAPTPIPMQDPRLQADSQMAQRVHAERYCTDARLSMSPHTMSPRAMSPMAHNHHHLPPPSGGGVGQGLRVDLGNQWVGTDSLHTILRCNNDNSRSLTNKSYYYG